MTEDLICQAPGCGAALTYSGKGRRPSYCGARCRRDAENVKRREKRNGLDEESRRQVLDRFEAYLATLPPEEAELLARARARRLAIVEEQKRPDYYRRSAEKHPERFYVTPDTRLSSSILTLDDLRAVEGGLREQLNSRTRKPTRILGPDGRLAVDYGRRGKNPRKMDPLPGEGAFVPTSVADTFGLTWDVSPRIDPLQVSEGERWLRRCRAYLGASPALRRALLDAWAEEDGTEDLPTD